MTLQRTLNNYRSTDSILEITNDHNFAGTLNDDDEEEEVSFSSTKCGRNIDETSPIIGNKSKSAQWIKQLVRNYERSIASNAILTVACQAFILSSLGDVCAQMISMERFEVGRLFSVGVWAFFVIGPVGLWWYEYLQSKVYGRYAVLQWVAIDQLLFAPVFIAFFIVGTTTLEGEVNEIWDRLRINLIPTILANYLIWPAAQVINFMVIPTAWRMLYVNMVGFFWSIILTFFSHNTAENGPSLTKIHLLNWVAKELYSR